MLSGDDSGSWKGCLEGFILTTLGDKSCALNNSFWETSRCVQLMAAQGSKENMTDS